MKISIVLRTRNEARAIGKTLELLSCQAHTPRPEVIVVDSGSTDDTVTIASRHASVRIIHMAAKDFTFGRSLNIGAESASGEVIVALSAHAFPLSDRWLQRLVAPLSDPEVAGVYGRQLPHGDAWPSVQRDYFEFYGATARIQTDAENPKDHCFSNSAAAFRRSLWEKHPFDEDLPYCEDLAWARTMLELGYKIVYQPSAEVSHSHNEPLGAVYRRCRQEMTARGLLYRQSVHGDSDWCRLWARSVLADMAFIRKHGHSNKWLFWVPIYRLFWSMGRSSRFMSRLESNGAD